MKYLKNPTDNHLKITYGPNGLGTNYYIKPKEIVAFIDEAELIYKRFQEIYGFLVEPSEEEIKKSDNKGKYECKYCGRDCKTVLALEKHEEACEKKEEGVMFNEIRTIHPMARSHKKSEKQSDRSKLEDKDFGNTDLAGVGVRQGEEIIGKEIKKVVYDRDGVAWYGPGVENDMSISATKKAGNFN